MDKTIRQALIDEVHYPLSEGFIDNKLCARGLLPASAVTQEVLLSNKFKGAVADCLASLVQAPNFGESDKSISLSDKDLIVKMVNRIYAEIGEDDKCIDKPMVYMGAAAIR